jgi:hypothetical protein
MNIASIPIGDMRVLTEAVDRARSTADAEA